MTLRTIRTQKGLTQEQLSRLAGISQSYISQIERGKVPSLRVAKRIAKALGVPVSTLLPLDDLETKEEVKV